MQLSLDLMLALLGEVFTAGAIYGAIRGDLLLAKSKAADAHALAVSANERIDNMLLKEH